jgi:uncharacterized UPF0146 family protein
MSQVILISGLYNSGKSEIGKFLNSKLNENYVNCQQFAFADKVKLIAKKHFGWNGLKDKRGRKLLQNIGNFGREYNKDIWVEVLSQKIKKNPNTIFIVDDWRYPNEMSNLKYVDITKDIYTIRVTRNVQRSKIVLKDPSESSLPEDSDFYDSYIYNNFDNLESLKNSSELQKLIVKLTKNFIKY